jgi:predicted Zn-dependent peptidase
MSRMISQLPNGLTVATDSMPHARSVALGVWVGVGTRDEDPAAQGVAHLVEHMLFKGTQRRDARAISEAIENVGGYINAHTGREETAYYVRILPEQLELATDVLADMLLHSILDPQELERERGVIIQEIGQALDTPEDYVFDSAQHLAFPEQGLGWSILGQASVIATMPRQGLSDWLSRHYHTGSMIFAAAGQVQHEDLLALAERFWAGLPKGQAVSRKAAQYQGGKRHENRDLEQHHCVMAFPASSIHAPDFMAEQVLAIILGGGSASRLFQEVREKRGLAYHVSAGGQAYSDAGLLYLYAGTAPEQAQALEDILWQELARLPKDLKPEEVQRAQAQLRAGLLMGQESAQARLEQLAGNWLSYGRALSIEERLDKIAAVTPAMVAALAQKLTPDRATLMTLSKAG